MSLKLPELIRIVYCKGTTIWWFLSTMQSTFTLYPSFHLLCAAVLFYMVSKLFINEYKFYLFRCKCWLTYFSAIDNLYIIQFRYVYTVLNRLKKLWGGLFTSTHCSRLHCLEGNDKLLEITAYIVKDYFWSLLSLSMDRVRFFSHIK